MVGGSCSDHPEFHCASTSVGHHDDEHPLPFISSRLGADGGEGWHRLRQPHPLQLLEELGVHGVGPLVGSADVGDDLVGVALQPGPGPVVVVAVAAAVAVVAAALRPQGLCGQEGGGILKPNSDVAGFFFLFLLNNASGSFLQSFGVSAFGQVRGGEGI